MTTPIIALLILCSAAGLTLAWLHLRRQITAGMRLRQELAEKDAELLRREEQLNECHSRDRQLIMDADEALFALDPRNGALLEINHEAEKLLGYTRGEVSNLTFKVLFSREQRQRLLRMINQAQKVGRAEVSEIKFRRKDGRQFIGTVKIRTGWIGKQRVLFGSFRDTTQVVNLQLELQRHNRHLTLLNDISQRVAEGHDLQHTLEIILDEVIKSFGISGGGIYLLQHRGTEMKLDLHRNLPKNVQEEISAFKPGEGLVGKVAETGRPRLSTNLLHDHRRLSRRVAEDGWQAFLAVPLSSADATHGVLFIFDRGNRAFRREDVRLIQAIGRQVGPLVRNAELFDELQWQHRLNFASMRELERSRTTLHEYLEQLEQNQRMLKGLNQMKSSFLALASHELRTPLTSIISGAEYLKSDLDPAIGDNLKKTIDIILRSGQRLNHIVDDLIEAARIEAKALYLARETVNPYQLIKEVLDSFRPRSIQQGLTLEMADFPDDTLLHGDTHHLKRAFGRLLENALKFTPRGGLVQVSGRVRTREEVAGRTQQLKPFSESFFSNVLADNYLEISLCDNGVGLVADELVRVFDKFHEVGDISRHSSSQVNFGGKGVGLGLTLVKGIIETHEGLIWAESAGPQLGSCFLVLLPLADPNEGRYVLG